MLCWSVRSVPVYSGVISHQHEYLKVCGICLYDWELNYVRTSSERAMYN
jgi:hypothetical protein